MRIDALRRAGRETSAILNMDAPQEDGELPDEIFISAEQDERIRSAIGVLNEEQRRVVQLSFIDDKPHSEIARELGIPLGTVKSRIRLAVQRLRSVLEGRS